MIDPILPLSISMAEGKSVYALLLGSGVSIEAGVPTGRDIFWETMRLIYRETGSKDDDEAKLKEWFEASEYATYTYSDILGALFPAIGDRHQFVAKHFDGKVPGPSHKLVAEMVEQGLVKAIVTTNFDPLMEHALDEKKISYCVVASDEDVQNVIPLEHSKCWIMKVHGDYRQQTIRNTPAELASLSPGITAKFKEIVDRHGLVVIGYGGTDRGVMSVLEGRFPRYTLYWVSRNGQVNEAVKSIIMKQDGRVIQASTASAFLSELIRRSQSYAITETGDTVTDAIRLAKTLAYRNDRMLFKDETKRLRRGLLQAWPRIYDKNKPTSRLPVDKLNELSHQLLLLFSQQAESLLGQGLVVLEYDKPSWMDDLLPLFQDVHDMVENMEKQPHSQELLPVPWAYAGFMWWVWCAYALENQQWPVINKCRQYRIYRSSDYSSMALSDPKCFAIRALWFYFDKTGLTPQIEKDYMEDFFQNSRRLQESLIQVNFVMGLVAAKNKQHFFPWFRRFNYYEGMNRAADRLKTDFVFTSALAKNVFNEEYDSFVAEFPSRCDALYSGFNESWFLEDTSPRNIFTKQTDT
ncbi:MAG: SIR2 family protein [Dehalococcoidia bacterium]